MPEKMACGAEAEREKSLLTCFMGARKCLSSSTSYSYLPLAPPQPRCLSVYLSALLRVSTQALVMSLIGA